MTNVLDNLLARVADLAKTIPDQTNPDNLIREGEEPASYQIGLVVEAEERRLSKLHPADEIVAAARAGLEQLGARLDEGDDPEFVVRGPLTRLAVSTFIAVQAAMKAAGSPARR